METHRLNPRTWRLRFWKMSGRDWEQLYGDRVNQLQAIIRARLA